MSKVKERIKVTGLIIVLLVAVATAFIKDNEFLNYFVIISGTILLLFINVMEPLKQHLNSKNFGRFRILFVLINLLIAISIGLYLIAPSHYLIIVIGILFIISTLIDILAFKKKELINYMFLAAVLVNLFYISNK